MGAAAARWACFMLLWLVLFGANGAASFCIGAMTAGLATWSSLALLPSGDARPSAAALATFGLRFLRQSALAGFDVARRALDPRMPLRLGFIIYAERLPVGPARSAFTALTSLIPGTAPCGTVGEGVVLVHCLDTSQPVAAQMTEEEVLLGRALGIADG